MEFVIITGLSGAGKSHASSVFEDMGFFCVDNLPIPLIPKFAQLGMTTSEYQKVAIVADIRAGNKFSTLFQALEELKEMRHSTTILYLDSDEQTIVKRYKETRRNHPLSPETTTLLEAIEKEREILEPAKQQADYIINTGILSSAKLKDELYRLFHSSAYEDRQLDLRISSFGFKHGLPIDADLVFDVRFLPNPYYNLDLRAKTGLDQDVRDFVFQSGLAQEFIEKLQDMIAWLLPHYISEGKNALVIAIGCTGGHHRSVTFCHLLARHFTAKGIPVTESHRDLGRI